MSSRQHPVSRGWAGLSAGARPRAGVDRTSPPVVILRAVGVAALGAGVCAAAWLALGAASTPRWLELPTKLEPHWVAGAFRGLTAGSLSAAGLSAGLIVLLVSYGVALVCSRWISLRVALGAVILANLAFTLGPSILSTDVFGYVAYARELVGHGLNPYVASPSSIPHDVVVQFVYWKGEPSPYGPLFTILSAPLGLVSAAAALWSLKAAAGIAAVLITFLAVDLARRRQLDPVRVAIFVGLNPVALFYAVSGAHNDLFAVALVLGGITFALRRADLGAGAAALAAAAIKVTLGLALPFVLILVGRRGRALGGAALAAVVIGGLTLALFGAHVFDQLHRITTQARFDTRFSGPDRLAVALGIHITPALRTLCTAMAGAGTFAGVLWAWRGHDPVAAAGWACLGLLASIASLAPWYLVWLLPLAAVGHSRRLRMVAMLATLYLICVHLPALGGEPWIAGPT